MEPQDHTARERALRRLDSLGYVLDNSIPIPGTGRRFGLDAVIGLIPGVGDATGAVMSAYIVVQAARLGAPASSLVRMLLNVGIEALVGAIPFVGDLFDAWFKANARNVALLRGELDRPGSTRRSSTAVVVAVVIALVVILGAMGWLAFSLFRALWQAIT
ncbi:MAG TPA: DUF4112 domain-containing protein [Longimicrobium sp.]|jgi:hypothetical protein|uniref:DUF4112 domain-containing protein n=1 Tax=Longimicrobium sp. TaxID=2029185 RepID=UPI002EDBA50B